MFQSNNLAFICTLLMSVIMTGYFFIRRAIRYKKDMDKSCLPGQESSKDTFAADAFDTFDSKSNTKKNFYLLCFICRQAAPMEESKYIKIRYSYYERIKQITQVIGKNEVSISAYVDNVLKAHFEENKECITMLYNESLSNIFDTDQ